MSDQKRYTLGEEIASSISHGVGGALAVWGLILLILKSSDAWQTVSVCLYGASLIILFVMSCLYHAIAARGAKRVMRVFDHNGIFFLIAGTYTPFTLVTLRGALGWVLFGIVWSAAIVGIVFNSISVDKFRKFSMVCYIAMGWSVVIAVVPMIRSLEQGGLWLLLSGGITYTIGILFYKQKSRRWFHFVWHLFVLAAAVLQFLSIYLYVIG